MKYYSMFVVCSLRGAGAPWHDRTAPQCMKTKAGGPPDAPATPSSVKPSPKPQQVTGGARPWRLPGHLRRQAHQDGVDIPAGLQAKDRAAVMQQVEFDIAPAPHQLMGPLGLGPGLMHAVADDPRIGVEEGLPHIAGEGEIILDAAAGRLVAEVIIKDAAQPARFIAMRQVEIFVAPFFETRVIIRIVLVAGRLEAGMKGLANPPPCAPSRRRAHRPSPSSASSRQTLRSETCFLFSVFCVFCFLFFVFFVFFCFF